jgi:hypothetical protein
MIGWRRWLCRLGIHDWSEEMWLTCKYSVFRCRRCRMKSIHDN